MWRGLKQREFIRVFLYASAKSTRDHPIQTLVKKEIIK